MGEAYIRAKAERALERLHEIDREYAGRRLPKSVAHEWDEMVKVVNAAINAATNLQSLWLAKQTAKGEFYRERDVTAPAAKPIILSGGMEITPIDSGAANVELTEFALKDPWPTIDWDHGLSKSQMPTYHQFTNNAGLTDWDAFEQAIWKWLQARPRRDPTKPERR
jgi:hypothetical protein